MSSFMSLSHFCRSISLSRCLIMFTNSYVYIGMLCVHTQGRTGVRGGGGGVANATSRRLLKLSAPSKGLKPSVAVPSFSNF